MTAPVRFGVVGLGFGEHHVRTLVNLARARLVAVCDNEQSRLERIASAYGVAGFSDALQMIEHGGIDALSVCVSPKLREPILRAGVAKGIPLFVEKPWATNAEHAYRLAGICEGATAPLMVGFSFRFHPAVRKAQELLRGPLGHAWMGNGGYVFDWLPPAGSWLWDPGNGNGFFNENSCHLFDVTCALMGEPVTVFAMGTRFVDRPSEVSVAIALRFEGEAIAALTAGGIGSSGSSDFPRLDLYTERGHLRLSGHGHTWQSVEWSIRGESTSTRCVSPMEELGRTRYSDAFDHFIECIIGGLAPEATVADGVRSVLLADAINRSFERKAPVDIDELRSHA